MLRNSAMFKMSTMMRFITKYLKTQKRLAEVVVVVDSCPDSEIVARIKIHILTGMIGTCEP